MSSCMLVRAFLETRLKPEAREWLDAARDEIWSGVDEARFGALLSLAARRLGFGARETWQLADGEVEAAQTLMEGWDPSRWTALEASRFVLVLSRPDLTEPSAAAAIESAFRFADEGELCALYRSLAHLPTPKSYVWRAAEGCRTNMLSVFEANVLDTPFPSLHFDGVAFNQAAIKALFIGAPLWRLWSLDRRLSQELAKMALDLVAERRAATRPIQPELWMCLGTFAGAAGAEAIEAELAPHLAMSDCDPQLYPMNSARAAVLALGRAGLSERLHELEQSAPVALAQEAKLALAGGANQNAWARFDPRETPMSHSQR